MRVIAIIPAGGRGSRMGSSTPKQYLKINNKEIIVHTLEVFQKNKNINEIVVACAKEYIKKIESLKKKYKLTKLNLVVEGGKERQDSVYNALISINCSPDDLIAIHDAARVLLPQKVLNVAITLASKKGNAVVCMKAKDTLLKGEETVNSYVDRSEIFYVQTPQIFKYSDLISAFEKAKKQNFYGTDESMLVKRDKKEIFISEGSSLNFKVTDKNDIEILKKLTK